jgi:hypothetical protein
MKITTIGGVLAGSDGVLAEAGSDSALLDHRERRRQRAGAQQDGEIVRRLHAEITGNLAGTAGNGFADDRRRKHFVVEHDRKRLADILGGHLGKLAGADGIEAKIHDRLAILIESRLRIDEIASGNEHALLDQIFRAPLPVENFRIGRRVRRQCLLRRGRHVDHAEIHFRRLAENLDQSAGILQAGHLHEDAAEALALDDGLDEAELVDAALDDLDRLIDRLAHPLGERGIRGRQGDETAVFRDVDTALAVRAEYTGKRLRKLAQLVHRVFNVGVAGDAHLDAVALDGAAGELNVVLAENAQHIFVDGLQPILAHRIHIDLEQEARSALQIEPQHHVALRPGRPGA